MSDKPKGIPTGNPYNAFPIGKVVDDNYERKPVATVNAQTQMALEELKSVRSLAHFVEICEEQRRKRGW
jgi:hypothetical protein